MNFIFLFSQGDAVRLSSRRSPGPGYIGPSARGIALNMQYRMFNAHALKGQHNLAQRQRPGVLNE